MKSTSSNFTFDAFLRQANQRIRWFALALLLVAGAGATAQQAPPSAAPPQQEQQVPPAAAAPAQSQSQDQTAPDAGGPEGDNGAIAIPKKMARPDLPPPPPPPVKNPPSLKNYSLRVDVPLVTVNIGVILEKTHQFVPNLQQANFHIYEDGVPQEVVSFQHTKAPITAVLLCEFAATNYWFINDMRHAAFAFAQQLQPDDYIAVETYDLNTHMLTDFTQDKRLVDESLNDLQMPTMRETDMFDALYQTLDRLTAVDGQKYIILISSGINTFSKITLDKTLQKIKDTPNVTIFAVGTGQAAQITGRAGGRGMFGAHEIDYLQAQNELNTFARMTGGASYFPRFEGEMPDIFSSINESIRNQYAVTYKPSNAKQDGTYRKIQVEVVDDEGHPLMMQDEKHHQLKYDVIARDGYRAKREVQ